MAKALSVSAFLMISLMISLCPVEARIPRINLSQTSLTIDKGKYDMVGFTLDEPIICKDMDGSCSVVVLLTNPNPNKISLDNCMVKWNWDEWSQTRYIKVSAVENFINDIAYTGTIIMGPAISRSEYYNGFRANNITVATIFKPSGYCSGTGDPHYTTFDGAYWHVYWSGSYVLYGAPHRDFEVQVAARSYPSQHCGFAAKEKNDIVVVHRCDGNNIMRRTCGTSTCDSGSFPKVSVVGSSYRVEFASGAMVRFDMYNSVYGNMYVTAPGQDYGMTQGICGNFNGNKNDDAPVYVASSPSQMRPDMIPKIDLFNWKPTGIINVNPSPYAKECNYTEPTYIRPILSNPDVEDITGLIKNTAPTVTNDNNNFVETIVDTKLIDAMEKLCTDTLSSSHSAQICKSKLPNFDISIYIDGCTEDMVLSKGDINLLEQAISDMENKCIVEATRDTTTWEKDNNGNPIQPNPEILNNICPANCNGNGKCNNAMCVCNDGFRGVDCSIDINTPPTITSLSNNAIDITVNNIKEISVMGKNIYNSDKLACKINTGEINPAFYMGSNMVLCYVPRLSLVDNKPLTVSVQLTTDGVLWSNPLPLTYYNSLCHLENGTVNPNSCNIDNVCYPAQRISPDNVCMRCQPSLSTKTWTYNYDNHLDCGPKFELESYSARIVEKNPANNVFFRVSAMNNNMMNNPDYNIIYKLVNSEKIFAINSKGEIYTVGILDTNNLPYPFNNMITVIATDNKGNMDTAHIVVTMQRTNTPPLFPTDTFVFNVSENNNIGSIVGIVKANDNDVDYDWSNIHYEIGMIDSVSVDNNGTITSNIVFDYEITHKYTGIVMAKDGGGMFHMAQLIINIINVDEAPTRITLDNNIIEENKVGLIGKLSCLDPENEICNYTTTTPNFKIMNGALYNTVPFNYEKRNIYKVDIIAQEHNNTLKMTLDVIVKDVNDAPIINTLSPTEIKENEKIDSIVSVLSTSDEDVGQTVRCNVVNNNHFILQNNLLILVSPLDYETTNTHNLTITCIDDGTPALYTTKQFTINVVDTSDPPNITINYFPVYENITKNTMVAKININMNINMNINYTITSRDKDYNIINNTVYYVGNGLDYENTNRYYVLLDYLDTTGASTTITLVINVIDIFEPPRSIVWDTIPKITNRIPIGSIIGSIYADGDDEYTIMLQNHMDKFALYDNKIITNNNIPAGIYNFDFAVNNDFHYNLELIVEEEPDIITINLPPVCNYKEELLKITIKDDINIGTTIANLNCTDPEGNKITYSILTMDMMLKDIINITSSGRVYIINTPSTRKASMGKYIIRIEASDGQYKDAFNLLITINDDCYDAPCGNNPCVDMFNSYVCKCKGGFVGASCDPDYINNVQAVSAENNTLSNATMAGIVVGVVMLMIIIIILLVVVFRRPNNKTSDTTVENSVVNPLFMKPSDMYNNNATYSYTNPMYGVEPTLQNDGDFVVRENKATPSWHQLSVRHNNMIYNDMIRIHRNDIHLNNTYELVAQSRNIGMQPRHNNMDDLVKYYSVDRGIGYTLNCSVLNNPMYMYMDSNAINLHSQYDVPALPLKEKQKDMIRNLADDNTNELYGNVADAKHIIIHDMNL